MLGEIQQLGIWTQFHGLFSLPHYLVTIEKEREEILLKTSSHPLKL